MYYLGYIVNTIFSSLIIYFIFKLIIKLINYIIFVKCAKYILNYIFEDEDEESDWNQDAPPSYKEDEKLHQKNKHRDKLQEAERMTQQSAEFAMGGKAPKSTKKIVGLNLENKIIGPWTKKIVTAWLKQASQINPELISNLGYHQAKEMTRKQANGVQDGFIRGG